MKILETELPGVLVIRAEPVEDERGCFARTFGREELEARGLTGTISQCALSHNRRRGTLRGLHYQRPPRAEAKVVACLRGAIHDVVLDLRRDSGTFGRWIARRLTPESWESLYIPEGCAHGFLTLADDTRVHYQLSEAHAPELSEGVRWDDPAFRIAWPEAPVVLSARDRSFPPFDTRDRDPGPQD